MFRLGQAITGCLGVLTRTIEAGVGSGDFHVDDPGLLANMLYASGLGTLQRSTSLVWRRDRRHSFGMQSFLGIVGSARAPRAPARRR